MDTLGIIRQVEGDPALRAQLRAVLLGDELLALPDLVRQLVAGLDQLATRLDQLTTRVDQLTARVDQLADAQLRTETTLREFIDASQRRFDTFDAEMAKVKEDLGALKGSDLERRVREDPLRYLAWLLRKATHVPVGRLAGTYALADEAFEELARADALVEGTDREGAGTWVLVEASWKAHADDFDRARRRAKLLAAAVGAQVLPVVVSRDDPGAPAETLAREHDVTLVVAAEPVPRVQSASLAA